MREDFHFVHKHELDFLYHAVLKGEKYKVSWDHKGNKGDTTFTIADTEDAIEKGQWIIQIV